MENFLENLRDIINNLLIFVIVFGPSIAAIFWFVVSLIKYKRTDKSSPKFHICRILTIVSGCIAGALVLSTAALVGLFFFAMSHM